MESWKKQTIKTNCNIYDKKFISFINGPYKLKKKEKEKNSKQPNIKMGKENQIVH